MGGVNWVANRAECSLQRVFQILAEQIDTDIRQAIALNRPAKFSFSKEVENKLIITRSRDLGGMQEIDGVLFELREGRIIVTRATKDMHVRTPFFSFTPAFTEEGECLVEIEGQPQPVKLWQVSRKALENLFFGF